MSGSLDETDVEYAELNELATALATAATDLDGDLGALARAVAVLNGSWSGDAQVAFDTAYRSWSGDADDLRATLARAAASIGRIADRYESTEAGVVSST